jgi:hypothetical protein
LAWGKVDRTGRHEADWVRVPAPTLRIVPDAVWHAAHARTAQSRASYLRATGGNGWGRPVNGIASKYLLTGLSRCGVCGGSFEVQSRSHGSSRAHFYACASYYRRGASVCANGLVVPLATMDAAVIAACEPLLTPAFVERVIAKVLTRAVPIGAAAAEARARIVAQLDDVRKELDRLVDGLARSGVSSTITAAIRQRELQAEALDRELTALVRREEVSHVDVSRLAVLARQKVEEWRKLLRRRTPQARQILRTMLRTRLVFVPQIRNRRLGYRFRGEGTILPLLAGAVPAVAAAGSGFVPNGIRHLAEARSNRASRLRRRSSTRRVRADTRVGLSDDSLDY